MSVAEDSDSHLAGLVRGEDWHMFLVTKATELLQAVEPNTHTRHQSIVAREAGKRHSDAQRVSEVGDVRMGAARKNVCGEKNLLGSWTGLYLCKHHLDGGEGKCQADGESWRLVSVKATMISSRKECRLDGAFRNCIESSLASETLGVAAEIRGKTLQ
ncbi:uncharacterized protein [Physcomitrium patens]|uniref:uncharacterized protein n=1 Tax=Physcomitrium patens TaxID=3218 RepID=UPI003CCD8E05